MSFVIFVVTTVFAFQQQASDGSMIWSGGIGTISDEARVWNVANLELDGSTGEFKGKLRTSNNRIYKVEGKRDGDSVALSLERRRKARQFKGRMSDSVITVAAVDEQSPRQIVLRRVDPISSDRLKQFAGMYEFTEGHRASFRPGQNSLQMTNYGNGKVRTAYPVSTDKFVFGRSISIPDPIEFEVEFLRNDQGKIDRVVFSNDESSNVATRRPDPIIKDFEYASFDGTMIRGSLYLPAGPGPHPAFVWVHGSGKVTRENAGSWPYYFSDLGFAVLAVDKRGMGKSEGTYHLPDGGGRDNFPHMRRRAKDVASAVQALAKLDEIQADQIGLVGASQAGWVIPMTVGQAEIACAIILSGGATPLSIEGRFSRIAAENSSGSDLRPVETLVEELRSYVPRDEGIDTELRQLSYPCLWLYGLKDRSNPSQLCAERINGIAEKHKRDFDVKLFPDGSHSLLVCQFGGGAESRSLDRLVPGLHATIKQWLDQKQLLPNTK